MGAYRIHSSPMDRLAVNVSRQVLRGKRVNNVTWACPGDSSPALATKNAEFSAQQPLGSNGTPYLTIYPQCVGVACS